MKKYFSKPSHLIFIAVGLALVLQTSLILRSRIHSDRASEVTQSPVLATPTPLASPQVVPSLAPCLVISLSERRVTLYSGNQVRSYPIAVGRKGWETPTGEFKVMDMRQNPIWINPFTGKSIPSGDPKNPLGAYWIGFWTDGNNWIGFHGTPEADSVGQAVSHGCVRMYNQDIEALFQEVSLGTSVRVVP